MATLQQAMQARDKVARLLRDLPGINGIGVTWDDAGEPCVRVNVDFEIDDSDRRQIPSRVGEIPVLVEEVGALKLE